jgi:hypothetical protein
MQSTPVNTQRGADPLEKKKELVVVKMLVVKMLQLTGCNRFFRRSLDTSIFRTD